MLPSGGVKELCVLAVNAPLLHWTFYSFPLAAFLTRAHTHSHTHTHTHKGTHSRFNGQILVLKDGRKQKPEGFTFWEYWNTL